MEEIGRAAALGRAPADDSVEAIASAARKAPLAEEPFLVRGITAQLAGDANLAERAFRAARVRAPREPAPRYFLAQQLLFAGRAREGLQEIATLARLVPSGAASLAPILATYARTPGALPLLRALFRAEPQLGQAVLARMAAETANADIILSLADAPVAADEPVPEWARLLIERLVADGQYARAHRLWLALDGSPAPNGGIFDPEFRGSQSPPPFNWTFASGEIGIVEPAGDGTLRILFHGRQSGALAGQMLLLQPGDYTLSLRTTGGTGPPGTLRWLLTCMPEKRNLLEMSLDNSSQGGQVQAKLEVPATGCPAQMLQLLGHASDTAQPVDLTISGLTLRRSRA